MENNARVALITGASRGVGRATAVRLAREGFRLCLAARNAKELEKTRHLSGLSNDDALIVPVDLGAKGGPGDLFRRAFAHFGRIDVLLNNAGVVTRGPIMEFSEEELDESLAVNLRAPIILTRLVAAEMVKAGSGTIINISSRVVTLQTPGRIIYVMTKGALGMFSRLCFAEFGNRGIKISTIVLGLTDTEAVPNVPGVDREKMLKADQIAETIWQIISSPREICPLEIEITPQYDPASLEWRMRVAQGRG